MRRPRRKGRSGDWLGAALIALAVLALGGFAAASFVLRAPPTDSATLCRTDAPAPAHTLILVDATDRLEPRHRRRLEAVVRQEQQRLPRYGRLTLMALRADRPQEPRQLFSLCNPGDGASANPLFQNTKAAQTRWEEGFGAALDRAIRRAGAGRAADASPILASLRAAAADPDFAASPLRRRLVLVSDLLEYEPGGLSLYDPRAPLAPEQAAPAALDAVEVRVAPLDRPDHAEAQRRAARFFWAPYLTASGANSVRIDAGL